MAMNAMQKALVIAGFTEEPKGRKRKGKTFQCNKCGNEMYQPEDTNVMVCPNCEKSYFIFSKKKGQ